MSTLFHRLKSLYVLDVVLQTGSFSLAAEKLYMTQSAVSQHIKQLESDLGPLFIRNARTLEATELAKQLSHFLKRGFSDLERGWHQAIRPVKKTLAISVLPSFASNWLIPRLDRFSAKHPDIELQLSLSEQQVDFERSNVDAGIRYGTGQYADLIAKHLMDDYIFPVANVNVLNQQGKPLSLDDLADYTLIRDNHQPPFNWEGWLEFAGCPDIHPKRYLTISDASLVIKAATAGQGIGLTRRSLVMDELNAGVLCQPFPFELQSPYSYFFVMPPRSRHHHELTIFSEWLFEEIQSFQQQSA